MNNTKILSYSFATIYQLYIQKIERKGKSISDLDTILFWLTGYNQKTMQKQIDKKNTLETFFEEAPEMNSNISKITGLICGHRVEEIEDKLMQKIRYMDKLVDELAKGNIYMKLQEKLEKNY